MLRTLVTLWITCVCMSWTGVGRCEPLNWPQWRGPDRTDLSDESGLLKSWPESGPRRVWLFRDCGAGYSGPAVVGERLYILGARDGQEQLLALNVKSGQEQWSAPISETLTNGWGDGPRSTPTVDGDRIYVMTGRGTLACVSTNGKVVWSVTMEELGGNTPSWGYCESPLVDGEQVVCTPGGKRGAIAALDKRTGELRWQSEEFQDGAQYASLIAVEHGGKRQYIQLTQDSIAGVDASTGDLLWRSDWPGQTAVIPTPVFHQGHVYVTSGYGVGCKLIKLNDDLTVEEVYQNKVMKNHHGGVILLDGHVYGHSDGAGWVCQDFLTGELVWNERSALGKGAIGYADGMFYCLAENGGDVALIEATSDGWQELGRFQLDPQSEIRSPSGRIWTHPVIVNGQLFLRDQDLLFCFDVKGN